jgi:hypothetical protein
MSFLKELLDAETLMDGHIDAHADAIAWATAAGPAVPGTEAFCVVYPAAKVVIQLFMRLMFWKPKCVAILNTFLAGLDVVCSSAASSPVAGTAAATEVPQSDAPKEMML